MRDRLCPEKLKNGVDGAAPSSVPGLYKITESKQTDEETGAVVDLRDMPSLLSVAAALLDGMALSGAEKRILESAGTTAEPNLVLKVVKAVRDGSDPLGEAYCRINSARARRNQGQTFTPEHVVCGMFAWAKRQ